MNHMKTLILASAAALVASPAFAAEVDADAGAEIIAPLQISNGTALYFGTIAPSLTTADSVTVSAAGAKNCGAELTCLTDDHTAASFNVTGEADYSYTIQLPDAINISNSDGVTMNVDSFTGSQSSGTLTAGADSFTVGGTLDVAANQPTGEYTGTFVVAVEYQ